MNEKSKQNGSEAGPVGGEKLRAARRANDISVRDVAKELHIDETKVRALERNEFDILGAPVFAKGHLKKYAEIVDAPVDDIIADYYLLTRSAGGAGSPPLVARISKPVRDINIGPWIGGVLLLTLVAGGLYWWFEIRDDTPTPVADPGTLAPFSSTRERVLAPAAQPATPPPEIVPLNTAEPPLPATSLPAASVAAASPAEDDASSTQPASAAPATGGSDVSLVLTFSGDCWTEISDATGRQLFYNLAAAGRVLTLRGEPPLRVILGNAGNVSITVDGAAWPIPAAARSGRLARLTINAP